MTLSSLPVRRQRPAVLTAAVTILAAAAAVLTPTVAHASASGYPDLYCYATSAGPGRNNPTRLWLRSSAVSKGKLSYVAFAEQWDNQAGRYYGGYFPTSVFTNIPPDKRPSTICGQLSHRYQFGVVAG